MSSTRVKHNLSHTSQHDNNILSSTTCQARQIKSLAFDGNATQTTLSSQSFQPGCQSQAALLAPSRMLRAAHAVHHAVHCEPPCPPHCTQCATHDMQHGTDGSPCHSSLATQPQPHDHVDVRLRFFPDVGVCASPMEDHMRFTFCTIALDSSTMGFILAT